MAVVHRFLGESILQWLGGSVVFGVFFVVFFAAPLQAQSSISLTAQDKKTYDSLGLSEVEWIMVKQHEISMRKLGELLQCGVLVAEYVQNPWMGVGLKEEKWLQLRRSGYTTYDIKLMYQKEERSSDYQVIHNFFLPGFHQFKRGQNVRGWLMCGSTVASMALFTFHKNGPTPGVLAFDRASYIITMLGGMLWSSIDIGVQNYQTQNPGPEFGMSVFPDERGRLAVVCNKKF